LTGAERPERELKSFDKVSVDPGEEATVRLPISLRDLECFNEETGEWTHATGEYGVYVGSSYVDIRLSGTLTSAEGVEYPNPA